MKTFNIETFELRGELNEGLRVSWGRDVEALAAALRAAGACLQPVVVWPGGGDGARLVHGFRRVEAARRLGWAALPAVALPAEWTEREAYLTGLEMFLATDAPNAVEAALIVRRLERWFERGEIIERFLPRLGLQPALVVYQRTRAVADLPLAARRGLASGALDVGCAHWLEQFDAADRETAASVVMALRASRSVQRELLETMSDVIKRDEIGLKDLLAEFGIRIAEAADGSGATGQPDSRQLEHGRISDKGGKETKEVPQIREEFRRWLRARRFPILTEQERRFETARGALGLPGGVTLTPPPHFESARHELRLSFASAGELERQLAALRRLLDNEREKIERLWE